MPLLLTIYKYLKKSISVDWTVVGILENGNTNRVLDREKKVFSVVAESPIPLQVNFCHQRLTLTALGSRRVHCTCSVAFNRFFTDITSLARRGGGEQQSC